MDVKYILIISLLLTIITLGVVSASEDIGSDDELTINNDDLNKIDEISEELSSNDDEVISQSLDDSKLSDDELEINVFPNIIMGDPDSGSDVARITGRSEGNVSVLIDDVEKYNKQYDKYGMFITYNNLKINCGEYNMKINFINETTTKLLYDGPLNITYFMEVNGEYGGEFSDYVEYDDYMWEFGVRIPRDAKGTLTVNFNGTDKEIEYTYAGKVLSSSIHIDGLSIGEHKIKVSLTNDSKYPDKTIEHSFYVIPKVCVPYYISVGEKEFITVELPKGYKGTVKVYNSTYHEYYDDENYYLGEYYEIDHEIGTVHAVNGLAKIPVKDLVFGENDITIICDGDGYYNDTYIIYKYFENCERFTSSISSEVIEVGSDVVVKINAPKSSTDLCLVVDNDEDNARYIALNGGEITESISGLSVGEHKIKLTYHRSSDYYSNSFYVTVKEKSSQPSNSSGQQNPDSNATEQDKNVTVVVDGLKYPAEFVNGIVTIKTNMSNEIENFKQNIANLTNQLDDANKSISDLKGEVDDLTRQLEEALANNAKSVVVDGNEYLIEYVNGVATVKTDVSDYGGSIIVVDGKEYSAEVINGTATVKTNAAQPVVKKDTVIEVDSAFTRVANDYYAGEKGEFFYAILKDSDGNILANRNVSIAVNGPIYNVITDDQGRAGLQVNFMIANTYTYALSFQGDGEYNAAPMASSKLTITKKAITISASSKSFKAKAKKTIKVTLKAAKNPYDGKVYLKSGKKVTLKVNGKTYTAKAKVNGIAKFTIDLNKKGKYSAKINFEGDKTYNSASKKIKITIK